LDVLPARVPAPTDAERLHHRFLGGEARGVALRAAAAPALAVTLLARRVDAVAEARAVRCRERALDAVDLGDVDSGRDDQPRPSAGPCRPLPSSAVLRPLARRCPGTRAQRALQA